MLILNVILTIVLSALAVFHLITGNIDHATFCAVLALSAEYSADKLAKRKARV